MIGKSVNGASGVRQGESFFQSGVCFQLADFSELSNKFRYAKS